MTNHTDQHEHREEPATDRTALIADAIGPTMLLGLQDAELFDEPGRERIRDWIKWISETVAALPADRTAVLQEAADAIDRETQALKDDGVLEPDKFRPCRDASAQLRRLAGGSAGRVAADAQPETEAHPPRNRWAVETYDYLADEWVPGTRFLNRHHAVERYEAVTEKAPMWRDGTPAQRRLMRETTTYTVEPAPAVGGADQTDATPVVCEGFQWIGQSFATCDRCGQPAWNHTGQDVPVKGAGLFDHRRTVRPWEPGEADAIRAKWGTPTAAAPAVGGAQQPQEEA